VTDETTRHYLIGVPVDSADFLRHQCPVCGLDFKLKSDPVDKQDSLSWWLHESVREAVKESVPTPKPSTADTFCPYCVNAGPKQDFVHPEVVRFIRAIARREIFEPLVTKLFKGFTDGFRSSRNLQVTVSHSSSRSPRPISGPEPADQVAIVCLTCGKSFKIDEGWRGTVRCPLCSTELLPH
jgi:hypothetical protein